MKKTLSLITLLLPLPSMAITVCTSLCIRESTDSATGVIHTEAISLIGAGATEAKAIYAISIKCKDANQRLGRLMINDNPVSVDHNPSAKEIDCSQF